MQQRGLQKRWRGRRGPTKLATCTKPPEQRVKPALKARRVSMSTEGGLGTAKYSRRASRKEKNREGECGGGVGGSWREWPGWIESPQSGVEQSGLARAARAHAVSARTCLWVLIVPRSRVGLGASKAGIARIANLLPTLCGRHHTLKGTRSSRRRSAHGARGLLARAVALGRSLALSPGGSAG